MQNKIHEAVENFYLEGFSNQVKREKFLKSTYKKQDEKNNAIINEADFSTFVNLLASSSQNFVNETAKLKASGDLQLVVESFRAKGYAAGSKTVEQLTMNALIQSVDNSFNESEFLRQADALNIPRSGKTITNVMEAMLIDKTKVAYKEDDVVFGDGDNDANDAGLAPAPEDENGETEDENDEKDAFQIADDMLAELDISSISNGVRIALIEAIIDSAQNSQDEDEANDVEFSNFMEQIQEVIDSFKTDEEEGEDLTDMGDTELPGDDELGEMGAKEPVISPEDEPAV